MENALKYGGNEVYVSGEERREGTYTVIVADNGSGVAEGDRERIFEHFEQLSKGDARVEQGVGLGLPIARKLVSGRWAGTSGTRIDSPSAHSSASTSISSRSTRADTAPVAAEAVGDR